MPKCDQEGCENKGLVVSRLSPEGFLVSSGKGAYSFREAYQRFNYCIECHSNLMRKFGLELEIQMTKMTIT